MFQANYMLWSEFLRTIVRQMSPNTRIYTRFSSRLGCGKSRVHNCRTRAHAASATHASVGVGAFIDMLKARIAELEAEVALPRQIQEAETSHTGQTLPDLLRPNSAFSCTSSRSRARALTELFKHCEHTMHSGTGQEYLVPSPHETQALQLRHHRCDPFGDGFQPSKGDMRRYLGTDYCRC